jgi:hypothetical protein
VGLRTASRFFFRKLGAFFLGGNEESFSTLMLRLRLPPVGFRGEFSLLWSTLLKLSPDTRFLRFWSLLSLCSVTSCYVSCKSSEFVLQVPQPPKFLSGSDFRSENLASRLVYRRSNFKLDSPPLSPMDSMSMMLPEVPALLGLWSRNDAGGLLSAFSFCSWNSLEGSLNGDRSVMCKLRKFSGELSVGFGSAIEPSFLKYFELTGSSWAVLISTKIFELSSRFLIFWAKAEWESVVRISKIWSLPGLANSFNT